MDDQSKWLTLSSVLYLTSSGIGTVVAIQQNLRADFGGFLEAAGGSVVRDFVTMNGTALSPPLIFLALQAIFTVLLWRSGRTGLAGVAGLTVLGAIYALAQLGGPSTLRMLNPATFKVTQAVILAANLILSAAILVFGIREWRSRVMQPRRQAGTEPRNYYMKLRASIGRSGSPTLLALCKECGNRIIFG